MGTVQSTLKLTLLDQVSARAQHITRALNGIQRQATMMSGSMRGLIAFGATYLGVTQGIENTVGAALSFESAFADVKKVVDASDQQLQAMSETIRNLSTVIPTTANDLAALYAAAAESGIATNELSAFAKMAAQIGIAFDIPASQAGESLAKLKTQLGLTVTETGDLADAMNHLSNNMASKASDITAFMLKVGALAKMGGLAKEEIAALGSAMIAAGAEPEVAATALQNVVKAMTRGTSAKKAQKDVAKALGLNLPQLAKEMQKDAPKAIKKVLAAIAKQPKDRHISLLSDFFGDEAKAFAPLVGNIKLLDDALDSVTDRTKYAGSAYKEYIARANTTANVLQILQNKFAEFGRDIGDGVLPGVKEFALGIGDILDTFDERAHIFDDIKWAIKGLMGGLGFDGNIRDAVGEIGDFLFGEAKGPKEKRAHIAAVFAQFREWGADIKYLADQISYGVKQFEEFFGLEPGTIKETLGTIAGYGLTLGVASIGIGLAATAIGALSRALMVLSGASMLIGGAKGLAKLFGAISGMPTLAGNSSASAPATKTTPSVPPVAGWFSRMGTWMKGLGVLSLIPASTELLQDSPGETFDEQVAIQAKRQDDLRRLFGMDSYAAANSPERRAADQSSISNLQASVTSALALEQAIRARAAGFGGSTDNLPGKTKDDLDMGRPKIVAIDAASIAAMLQPSGVQDVREVNKQPPVVHVNVGGISITGVTDPRAAADAAASRLGAATKSAVESTNTD